LLIIKQINFN